MNPFLLHGFLDEMEKIALSAAAKRMLAGSLLAIPGAGAGALLADEEKRGKGALAGALTGLTLGAAGGKLFHRRNPIQGRMRSMSQALDNRSADIWTVEGVVAKSGHKDWKDPGAVSTREPPLYRTKQTFLPDKDYRGATEEVPLVEVYKSSRPDQYVAFVNSPTLDSGGRMGGPAVFQTRTRMNTQKDMESFAREAHEYVKKHHTNNPGGSRKFPPWRGEY